MAHECPYCGQECYCDCDDTGGLPQPADCPHLHGGCESDPFEIEEEYDEYELLTGEEAKQSEES